jgi:hypothetical protein
MEKARYRLIVGENGNDVGHIINTKAVSFDGAMNSAKRELKKYGGDGWAKIQADYGFGWEDPIKVA